MNNGYCNIEPMLKDIQVIANNCHHAYMQNVWIDMKCDDIGYVWVQFAIPPTRNLETEKPK